MEKVSYIDKQTLTSLFIIGKTERNIRGPQYLFYRYSEDKNFSSIKLNIYEHNN